MRTGIALQDKSYSYGRGRPSLHFLETAKSMGSRMEIALTRELPMRHFFPLIASNTGDVVELSCQSYQQIFALIFVPCASFPSSPRDSWAPFYHTIILLREAARCFACFPSATTGKMVTSNGSHQKAEFLLIDESVRKIECEAFTTSTRGVGFFLRKNGKPRYVNGIK